MMVCYNLAHGPRNSMYGKRESSTLTEYICRIDRLIEDLGSLYQILDIVVW